MSYEVLVTLAVTNAIATILLWRKVASGKINERPRLKKKAATALWRSGPIVPRHNPPRLSLASGIPTGFSLLTSRTLPT